MKEILFSSIEGIRIGNAENLEGPTGCTVVICPGGAVAGVDVRGGAPGTRETDLLNPVNMVNRIHAVLLAGGSAFGLDAAGGVMQYLEENNIGLDVKVTRVPIVCAAVLFDLSIGNCKIRPDRSMGYEACVNSELNICKNGNFGAGTGATVGKILGDSHAMKGGIGTYAVQAGDLKVGAVVAVNCLGDIVDNGSIIAGALNEDGKSFAGTENIMLSRYSSKKNLFTGNTTIGIVATNGKFTKSGMTKISSMAHNGYGRAMKPAHTMFDGDTIFSMSTGKVQADLNVVGFLAAEVVEKAILKAVKSADSLLGYKSYKNI
ncbi:P1 family peptidase [Clostridium luticellarii]|jgi:L-aminopeptidase/D-esterase-like protein|uniref:Peptidase family S58 n=1 Tax=Clostridium luticellarii TaxID=1691940 RepID=A0A2T0BEV8_9CLOT|nr:P1 family peptidase [Clostridium luticellarii]MCI1944834.1 P1 family peptidase [Clostridium luticellarii]MCI1968350.1 P1 family peptidase [Clostridium luticellarii]MCI1995348.1 P1 family peptidase [Clostridium luticellarii]MCI2039390.1 P1 family peptidase [Clostridium luticellarii]PRR82372.1 Peptidase family S58 [Clostridium luticellarii]